MSKAYLCRSFGREMGLPPHQYQMRLRMTQARTVARAGRFLWLRDLGFCYH